MKLNKNFRAACQARLDEKSPEYDGKDNPKNYKNMALDCLWYRLMEQTKLPEIVLGQDLLVNKCFKEETKKELLDISNFCQMLWERLGER